MIELTPATGETQVCVKGTVSDLVSLWDRMEAENEDRLLGVVFLVIGGHIVDKVGQGFYDGQPAALITLCGGQRQPAGQLKLRYDQGNAEWIVRCYTVEDREAFEAWVHEQAADPTPEGYQAIKARQLADGQCIHGLTGGYGEPGDEDAEDFPPVDLSNVPVEDVKVFVDPTNRPDLYPSGINVGFMCDDYEFFFDSEERLFVK